MKKIKIRNLQISHPDSNPGSLLLNPLSVSLHECLLDRTQTGVADVKRRHGCSAMFLETKVFNESLTAKRVCVGGITSLFFNGISIRPVSSNPPLQQQEKAAKVL